MAILRMSAAALSSVRRMSSGLLAFQFRLSKSGNDVPG